MSEDPADATERTEPLPDTQVLRPSLDTPSLAPTRAASSSAPPRAGSSSVPSSVSSSVPSSVSSSVPSSVSSSVPSSVSSSTTGAIAKTTGSRARGTLAESTIAALHEEAAARAAGFGRVVAALCVVGLVGQLGYGGHPLLRIAMAAAQAILAAVALWVWWRARDPARWSTGVFRVFGVTAALAAVVFIHFLGVFSPVTVVIILGLSFFAQADDARFITPLSVAITIAYAISALLVTFDVIPDHGLFASRETPKAARLAMLVMVTATMLMQLLQARLSRRATLEAIERSNEAVLIARTREAQLEEAKENLDAAIRAGAGMSGRYTGTTAGRFHLEHVVGRGAMGEVYAARTDDGVDRAAVKLLHVGKLDEPELVGRFLREADVARRVRGPNLVSLLEVGNAHDGSPFIAMELLRGRDLATLLRERPSLGLEEAVTLVEQVARGLDVLHAASVIHRDLKPANLFLSEGPPPLWKILDYGVSKLRESTMTHDQIVGTPGYMSPEQAQGDKIDHRSDIFALGAVAYRVLTGRRPFSGSSTPQLLYQVVYAQPVRPREIAAAIPRDVELVLAIALAKRAAARFPTALAFAKAMRAASSDSLGTKMRAHGERILRASPWSNATA